MDKSSMKIMGIICLVICLICIFTAIERYQENAKNVKMMQSLGKLFPVGNIDNLGSSFGIEAGVPAESKYAIFFAVISGIGGMVLLVKANTAG